MTSKLTGMNRYIVSAEQNNSHFVSPANTSQMQMCDWNKQNKQMGWVWVSGLGKGSTIKCVPVFISVNTKIITSQRNHKKKKKEVTDVMKTLRTEKRKWSSAEDADTRLEHSLQTEGGPAVFCHLCLWWFVSTSEKRWINKASWSQTDVHG